jgi:hypothetical protein
VELAIDVFGALENIDWLSAIGTPHADVFEVPTVTAPSLNAALSGIISDEWADVRTEAKGELTGYLAKRHYEHYGGSWNNLARMSRQLIEQSVTVRLKSSLPGSLLTPDLLKSIIYDLVLASLEISFRRRFLKAPVFFERLLEVYRTGHLPCGWSGDYILAKSGSLIVY